MVSATELELLTFFEVPPDLADPAAPWCYNDALYQAGRDGIDLSFALSPADHDVRIILKHGTRCLYELNAVGARDVRYLLDGARETLEVVLATNDKLFLNLKPSVTISHVLEQAE